MYRVVQFYRALTARVRPDELEAVEPLLGPSGMALFRRLSRNDQRHSLNVYTRLRRQGYRDQELLVAALLHDVGKAEGQLNLAYRIAITLLSAFSPRLLARLEADGEHALLRPFRLAREHAEIGAQLADEGGFSAATVELIRRHHEPTSEQKADDNLAEWVAALQRADKAN